MAVVAAPVPTAVAQAQRFPDVPADHYAYEAVECAGVTAGYNDGTFKPQRPLIRRHAIVFMERYYDEILGADQSEDFTRGDMMVLLKAINDGTLRNTGTVGTGGYTDVTVGYIYACALRTDGTVDCWGYLSEVTPDGRSSELSQQSEIETPDGSYESISAGEGPCNLLALRPDGGLECWLYEREAIEVQEWEFDHESGALVRPGIWRTGGQFVIQDGAPEGIFSSVDHRCGIRTDGTIACWGSPDQLVSGLPEGTFTSIAVNNINACAIRTDGTIACWGHSEFSDAPPGTFESADVGLEGGVCAIRAGGAIACWGNEQISSSTPEGTIKSVAVGLDHACAIRTGGTIACWGNPVPDWLWERFGLDPSEFNPPQGTFTTIDVGFFIPEGGGAGGYNGALRSDGTVSFWGKVVYWNNCCG